MLPLNWCYVVLSTFHDETEVYSTRQRCTVSTLQSEAKFRDKCSLQLLLEQELYLLVTCTLCGKTSLILEQITFWNLHCHLRVTTCQQPTACCLCMTELEAWKHSLFYTYLMSLTQSKKLIILTGTWSSIQASYHEDTQLWAERWWG